uniref:hypothetical protein n=1 Tax=Frankia sp. CiP3 TaxID=2880971 RepID=UPI0035ABC5D6
VAPDPEGVPSGVPGAVTVSRVERPPLVDHELIVTAGAAASDVSSVLVTVPADAIFVDHYGDVDLMMVFREVPATS